MLVHLVIEIILGAFIGFLAGKIMKMEGSWLRNIIVGIVGGAIGGIIFTIIPIFSDGMLGNIISGVIGSCILLGICKAISK